MRNDRDVVFAGLVLFRGEVAAHERLHSDRIEEVRCNEKSLNALRCANAGEIHVPPAIERELIERMILRPPVEVVAHRNFVMQIATTRLFFPENSDNTDPPKKEPG